MSKQSMMEGLPREVEEWLHAAVDLATGRTDLIAYTVARLAGLDPTQSVASAILFEMDAVRTWSSPDNPTRGELFATAERTILPPASRQPPASTPEGQPDVIYASSWRRKRPRTGDAVLH